MKIWILFGALALIASPAQAVSNLSRLLRGEIVAIDHAAKTLTVQSRSSGAVQVVWHDRTKIRERKTVRTPADLTVGRRVKLYYRTIMGAKTVRELYLLEPKVPRHGG